MLSHVIIILSLVGLTSSYMLSTPSSVPSTALSAKKTSRRSFVTSAPLAGLGLTTLIMNPLPSSARSMQGQFTPAVAKAGLDAEQLKSNSVQKVSER